MIDLFARRLAPSPDALESRVGDETIILHLGNDTYFGMDAIGTLIWGLTKEGLTLPEIRDRIIAQFGVEPERVEADIRRFVEELLRHGILVDA